MSSFSFISRGVEHCCGKHIKTEITRKLVIKLVFKVQHNKAFSEPRGFRIYFLKIKI